ncbi:radical SAM protein [Chloroflexota bacterium]
MLNSDNPVEGKYEITRQVIETLLSAGFGVTVLTKSALVTRDIDILRHPSCKVGLTITTLDDKLGSQLEPGGYSTSQRLAALAQLRDAGVSTWAFVALIIPTFTDQGDSIERLIGELVKCQVAYIASDTFSPFPSSWLRFKTFLKHNYPDRTEEIKNIIFSNRSYFTGIQEQIKRNCEENGITYRSGRAA